MKSPENQLDEFIEMLRKFSIENPYPKVKLPSTTSNIAIMQRMYIQHTQYGVKAWDPLLLANKEKTIYLKKNFNCCKQDKVLMVNERKNILRQRVWSAEEDDHIKKY